MLMFRQAAAEDHVWVRGPTTEGGSGMMSIGRVTTEGCEVGAVTEEDPEVRICAQRSDLSSQERLTTNAQISPFNARSRSSPSRPAPGAFGFIGGHLAASPPERRPPPAQAPAPQPAPQPAPTPSVGSSFFSSLSQAVKQTAASAGLVDAPAPAAARKAKVLLVVDEPHTD
ncbi:hypothetical protein STEG23_028217, partial [Scotinomys teguina]